MQASEIIEQLQLEAHVEGGFFRRIYQSDQRPLVATSAGDRYAMTAIYYLLSRQQPLGYLHRNRSDIMHVHNGGAPLRYTLIDKDGQLDSFVLGPDIARGQLLQRVVVGGVWKATELVDDSSHDYGLLTEVVVPGFDYRDMTLADAASLSQHYPQHRELLARLCKPRQTV